MNLKVNAPLDPGYMPMAVVYRDFQNAVKTAGGQKLTIGLERNNGLTSVLTIDVYKDGTGHDEENHEFVERLVKTLLWARGGYKVIIAGSKVIADKIKADYSIGGSREFDCNEMSNIYEAPFEVINVPFDQAPAQNESSAPVGRHLDGCRIGFDAGGSDRKVSAVVEGEATYSEEVVWFPKLQNDPQYHYDGIMDAMKTAASKMPRVDAIGVSTAGCVVDNRIKTSSLFLKVKKENPEAFEKVVKNIYIDIAKEFGDIPIEVANDGDVTALAGAMDLGDTNVLGIAMGTSEAGGYVDGSGNITGWLNELAFAPCDYNKNAMVDEWSGDYGCGVKYFSQDSVIKLAPAAGIELDESASPAEKLKVVQGLMAQGDERAAKIYETIGVYFGYAVAYYALFYDIKHVLLMGRVSSGEGGNILLKYAQKALSEEFPELADKITIHLPDESSRRVGQSIAAASLPKIK
ncbi:MAG: ROK family protein [Ruminococcaceae bacterium]|nr:ROK family protein [Oscillospiraceae bacterium]